MHNALALPGHEGAIRGTPHAAPDDGRAERWVLVATILGSSMAFIDGSVVNVALPSLQRQLGASAADAQWVVEAYSLFLAALILVGGSLGDLLGRRRIFAAGTILFTVASVWCGLAPNAAQLIAARAVQGVGGAMLVPSSLAIISAVFPEGRRGKAIGTWSGFTAVTSALGPVLGGWLVQQISWRAVFFINIPMAIGVLALIARWVPESRGAEAGQRLDLPGAALVTVGLGGVVYGLIAGGSTKLSDPQPLAAIGIGVLALILFVAVEARSHAPMVPLRLFRSRAFSGVNLLTFGLYAGLGGALYYVPFNLQQVQGFSATAAGAALLPFVILMFGLSRWSGGLISRHGARLPLTIGPLIAAAGFVLFARPGTGLSYWTGLLPAVLVLGLGMAITVAPLTTTVMGAVGQEYSGTASGINNAVSRTAGLLAIALMGILVSGTFRGTLGDQLTALHVSPAVRQAVVAQQDRLAGAQVPRSGTTPALRTAIGRAIDDSFIAGYQQAMLLAAALAVLSAICAALTLGKKTPAPPRA